MNAPADLYATAAPIGVIAPVVVFFALIVIGCEFEIALTNLTYATE